MSIYFLGFFKPKESVENTDKYLHYSEISVVANGVTPCGICPAKSMISCSDLPSSMPQISVEATLSPSPTRFSFFQEGTRKQHEEGI